MKNFEKLVTTIMNEAEADGEPVTREEAEEMARMELGEKANRRYEQTAPTKAKTKKARKVDTEKKHILDCIRVLIEGMKAKSVVMKTETELSFEYGGNAYTLKLTKHRPPK